MHLRSIELTNFRNFRQQIVELTTGPTLILGDNGQGKSNLLEAVELLGTTRSSRAGSDRELISWAALRGEAGPQPFARIRASVQRETREIRAEIIIKGEEQEGRRGATKLFRANGVPRRAADFVGLISTVTFSPLDVTLIDGPPSGRRRFLDVMNAQANSSYLRSLQKYQKLLLQRNHLLRDLRGRFPRDSDEATLGIWTQQLVQEGAYLIHERIGAVRDLNQRADQWFRELRGTGDHLAVAYRPTFSLPEIDSISEEAVREALALAFAESRAREVGAGVTLLGPHRDDMSVEVDGVDLGTYGSRGQQRLAALALKLGEAQLIENRVGSRPVLLMDDVLSELDPTRQDAVLAFAGGEGQTLLTSAAPDIHARPGAAAFPALTVIDGMVSGRGSAGGPRL